MKIGDIIEFKNSKNVYIVGKHSLDKVQLTNLRTGKRWSNSVKVNSYYDLTSHQIDELVSGNEYITRRS